MIGLKILGSRNFSLKFFAPATFSWKFSAPEIDFHAISKNNLFVRIFYSRNFFRDICWFQGLFYEIVSYRNLFVKILDCSNFFPSLQDFFPIGFTTPGVFSWQFLAKEILYENLDSRNFFSFFMGNFFPGITDDLSKNRWSQEFFNENFCIQEYFL